MKKVYTLFSVMASLLFYSQPYSVLLKNADWTIMKIQWAGTDYYPPAPFVTAGKVKFKENNNFESIFFNNGGGTVIFGNNNATNFNLTGIGFTLAEYYGENGPAVRQFDNMVTSFYIQFQPTDQFSFQYEEIFSGKNLIVTNPLGQKIFYSNMILANTEVFLNKEVSIYPNPAKNEFFLKSSNKKLEDVNVEIFDQSGKLVSTQKVSFENAVRIGSLPSGVYFVKISSSDFNYSSQLIVKK